MLQYVLRKRGRRVRYFLDDLSNFSKIPDDKNLPTEWRDRRQIRPGPEEQYPKKYRNYIKESALYGLGNVYVFSPLKQDSQPTEQQEKF